jgi:hypothetical protein
MSFPCLKKINLRWKILDEIYFYRLTIYLQVIPSGLPRNLEAAIQRYGSATYKAPAATVLDPNGKLSINLTYGMPINILKNSFTEFNIIGIIFHRCENRT